MAAGGPQLAESASRVVAVWVFRPTADSDYPPTWGSVLRLDDSEDKLDSGSCFGLLSSLTDGSTDSESETGEASGPL